MGTGEDGGGEEESLRRGNDDDGTWAAIQGIRPPMRERIPLRQEKRHIPQYPGGNGIRSLGLYEACDSPPRGWVCSGPGVSEAMMLCSLWRFLEMGEVEIVSLDSRHCLCRKNNIRVEERSDFSDPLFGKNSDFASCCRPCVSRKKIRVDTAATFAVFVAVAVAIAVAFVLMTSTVAVVDSLLPPLSLLLKRRQRHYRSVLRGITSQP